MTTPPCDTQMANTVAGYMDKLTNAIGIASGMFTAVNELLDEITATLKRLADSNASFAATITKKSKTTQQNQAERRRWRKLPA